MAPAGRTPACLKPLHTENRVYNSLAAGGLSIDADSHFGFGVRRQFWRIKHEVAALTKESQRVLVDDAADEAFQAAFSSHPSLDSLS